MIRQAALPNLDDRCGRLMMVTSFNEWYEDSQIEATAGDAGTTAVDNSESNRTSPAATATSTTARSISTSCDHALCRNLLSRYRATRFEISFGTSLGNSAGLIE